MKYVITGATGLIGSVITSMLNVEGNRVAAISRNKKRARNTLPKGVIALQWSEPDYKQEIAEADVVINLAGASVGGARWTSEVRDDIMKSRTDITRNVVDAIIGSGRDESRPLALVSASAVGYYGDCGEDEVTEDRGPGDDFLATVCRKWEEEALRAEDGGYRVARMRIGLVLAHEGALQKMLYPLPVHISPYRLGLGGPLGTGKQFWPWIHIDDVVNMFLWAAHDDAVNGAINTVAPSPERSRDFARAIGKCLHRPAAFPVPAFALRLMVGDFSEALLTGQKAVPEAALRLGYSFIYPELDEALRNLIQ